MKHTIRWYTWESNSSSVHSVVYRNLKHTFDLPIDKDGLLFIPLMELGKSGGCFTSWEKLSYLMTDLYWMKWEDVERVKESWDYKQIFECIQKFAKENGQELKDIILVDLDKASIDHQSIPYSDIEIINVYNEKQLMDFLFCDDVVVEFDCD